MGTAACTAGSKRLANKAAIVHSVMGPRVGWGPGRHGYQGWDRVLGKMATNVANHAGRNLVVVHERLEATALINRIPRVLLEALIAEVPRS